MGSERKRSPWGPGPQQTPPAGRVTGRTPGQHKDLRDAGSTSFLSGMVEKRPEFEG